MLGLMAGWILGAASCAPKTPAQTEIPGDYSYNENGKGLEMTLTFTRGKSHNHPLMAIWIENEKGEYLQTLYVAESIGKGIFHYGQTAQGKWMPGEIRRPAAVPYWAHKRNIQAPDGLLLPTPENPVADAYTGPKKKGSGGGERRKEEGEKEGVRGGGGIK